MVTQPVKVPNPAPGVVYYNKFPDWVRHKMYQTVEETCQLCHKHMLYKDMEIHRKNRKKYYTLCKLNHPKQNCMFIHKSCHKCLHSGEYNHISHRY